MNPELIALESLQYAKQSASWGFWSMIFAAVASVATLIAAGAACWALNIWKSQEKFKLKQEFKRAALQYQQISNVMPSWASSQERQARRDKFLEFQTAKIACDLAWCLSENAYNAEIKTLWEDLLKIHHEYMLIRADITKVQDSVIKLAEKLSLF